MKIALCFLALVSCAVALPAEVPLEAPEEIDWSKVFPENIYVEPINPVDIEAVELPGSRIIGGTEVTPNAIPHQVAVVNDRGGFCGGSLISTTVVLTAAHCLVGSTRVELRLGGHNINQQEATQVRASSPNIRIHAGYNSNTIANDVALVLLLTPISLNNHIRTIPLAPANAGTFEGSRAFLSGWGRTSDASNAISPVLRGVNLNIISNVACRNVYGSSVIASTLCTSGAGSVGGCNGDSGGPLTVNGVQVGVVSFGSRSCQAGNPTAFARVSSFRSWILQNSGV